MTEPKPSEIAASNLSQLAYFIAPLTHEAFAELPANACAGTRKIIEVSLKTLGFDLEDKTIRREVGVVGAPADAFDIRDAKALFFSREGVQRLVRGGVKSPALDALRPRTPAAMRDTQH